MTRIACVLRSGGEYNVGHVRRLRDQAAEFAPAVPFVCLSDVPISDVETIELECSWPGWWSKLELFRPDLEGDFLYLDLDSSIVGDLSDLLAAGRSSIMRDVYRPAGLQSSVMYIAARDREAVWTSWALHAAHWIEQYRVGGDQAFLERHWLSWVTRWQDSHPGQIVSFKVDCSRGVPAGARGIAFHGRPRPWEVGF